MPRMAVRVLNYLMRNDTNGIATKPKQEASATSIISEAIEASVEALKISKTIHIEFNGEVFFRIRFQTS